MIVASKYVQKIINDENLAWGKSLENKPEKFLCKLSEDAIKELKENISNSDFNNCELSSLQQEIQTLKKKFLINGVGFFIIAGEVFSSFSKSDMKKIYEKISICLGSLYHQNIKKEKFVEIRDSGKSMKTGGRYHQTKEGGSYHTDSPQWENVPDYVGLYCVSPAKNGGISKFVSVYKIHNDILTQKNEFLELFYEKFHFDKRGEFKKGEPETVYEPIFKIVDDELRCRYLRNYIDAGHDVSKENLTKNQIMALDYFDELSKKDENIVNYDLKSKDMLFFNNHRILHGRSSFEDFDDDKLKRLMIRAWIKDLE
tara:strand:- start:637 stop:1575 length:939 start_codon:yes stop_codon:yes gene_type:complete